MSQQTQSPIDERTEEKSHGEWIVRLERRFSGNEGAAALLPGGRLAAVLYPLVAIAGLVVWFSLASPNFLTSGNAVNVGRQSTVLMLAALGETFIILVGSIDLSIGGIVVVSGLVCAKLIDSQGIAVAILAAVAAGALVGFVSAQVVLRLRIPSFLVTLGMLSALTGIAATMAGGSAVYFTDLGLGNFMNGTAIAGVPNCVWLMFAILVLAILVAARTAFGRYLYAIGGNERVAALAGVPVNRYKVLAFVLSGALCGLAGVVATAQVGAGTLDVGSSLLLNGIAAVVMGGTALSGGVGGPARTFLGVAVIAILGNGMDVVGVPEATQDIITGGVIVAAVALSIDRARYGVIK